MRAKSRLIPVYPQWIDPVSREEPKQILLTTNYYIMKMNTTMKTTMSLAAAMGSLALTATSANAATIYSDDFNGAAVSTLGLAPDVAPGAEVWTGNGTQYRAIGDVTGSGSAYLAFAPTVGNVYTLSADVSGGTSGNWAGFGFISSDPDGANAPFYSLGGYGNFLYYPTTVAGANLNTYAGENTGGAQAFSSVAPAGAMNLKVVLDATDATSANWTMEWFLDGSQLRAPTTAVSGDYASISYAGFNNIAGSLTGTVDNFLLEDNTVIPEPSTTALLGLGGLALILRRRK